MFSISCELPNQVDWLKLVRLLKKLDMSLTVSLACSSKKDFLQWKKKINSKKIKLIAWPLLKDEEGYWFSGQIKKEYIDRLKEFKGIEMHIDLEPPYRKNKWEWLKMFFKKGKNTEYFQEVLTELKDDLTISTFAFPDFMLNWLGAINVPKNYLIFPSIVPWYIQPLYYSYLSLFLRTHKDGDYIIGYIGQGKFYFPKEYKTPKDLEDDIKWLKHHQVRGITIFCLEGLMKKKNPENWLRLLS
ncbi:MAG: hypothetical protein ABIF40_03100 [archaeon]